MPPSRRLWNIRSPFVSVYSRDLNPYSNSRSQGGSVRFFVAMFSHETNTFSTIPTDRRQFEARDLRYGGELLEAYRGTGTCLGGMIEAAGARGVTLVPSLAAAASPAGRVTADFYEATTRRLLDDLRGAGRLDGVLLDLHGAMVPEGLEDGGVGGARGRHARLPRECHRRNGAPHHAPPRLQDLPPRGHGRARPRGDRAAARRRRQAAPPDGRVAAASPHSAHRRPADRAGPDAAALRPRGRDGARPAGRDDLDLRRLPARRHPRRGPVGLRRDRRRPGPRRPARRRSRRRPTGPRRGCR